jgi:hypothetical protein
MPAPASVVSQFGKQILRRGFAALIVLLAAATSTAHSSEAENTTSPVAGIDLTRQPTEPNAARNRAHKKTVTFTRFQVANSLQVEDIADIWNGYPLELLRRLEARGNIEARHSTASPFPDPRDLNPYSSASRERVRRIAEQDGSELVVSGIILDAAVSDESIRPYFGWQGRETGRRFELGLPWNSVVAGIRPVATERRLEVEILIYDGLTGALLKRHRDNAEISGRAAVGRNLAFASAAFFETDFGEAVDHLINAQIKLIDSDLAQSSELTGDISSRKQAY